MTRPIPSPWWTPLPGPEVNSGSTPSPTVQIMPLGNVSFPMLKWD